MTPIIPPKPIHDIPKVPANGLGKYVSPQWDPILKALGAPSNPQNYAVLNAWSTAEGHNNYNNPFNTTLQNAGTSGYVNNLGDGMHVQKYKNYNYGVQATVDTLRNTRGVGYDKIIAGLRSSNPEAAIQAIVVSPWSGGSHYGVGSNGDYTKSSVWNIYSRGNSVPPAITTTSVKPPKPGVKQTVVKPKPKPGADPMATAKPTPSPSAGLAPSMSADGSLAGNVDLQSINNPNMSKQFSGVAQGNIPLVA
jgi:hypothetical protein